MNLPPTRPWSARLRIAAVIFDLDDTLFDHRGAAADGFRAWLAELDVEATDELLSLWFDAEARHFALWQAGEISYAEQRRARLREFLPWLGQTVGTDDVLDSAFQGYLSRYEQAWRCFSDVHAALAALAAAGIRTAILTNGATDQQHLKVARLGLAARIEVLLTAEELGVAKPAPRAYQLACHRLGLECGQVLHVGDRYDLDVVAARAAGLAALHLDRRDLGPVDEPDRLTALTGLPEFLRLRPADAPITRTQRRR